MTAHDARAVLAGSVWPEDPHDFVGDENDILDDILRRLDSVTANRMAQSVLELLGDHDLVIRTRAVIALSTLRTLIDGDDITYAVRAHRADLDVRPAALWKVRADTLWGEALARLR
ncbi:MAG: hypothetical protein ACKV2O_23260 [Acidimicrobiales bacterium]